MKRLVIDFDALGVITFIPVPFAPEIPISREAAVSIILGEPFGQLPEGEPQPARRPRGRPPIESPAARDAPAARKRHYSAESLNRIRHGSKRATAARIRQGLCVRACGRPAAPGKKMCVECLAGQRTQDPRLRGYEDAVLKALQNGPAAPRTVSAATAIPVADVRLAAGRLKNAGLVESEGWALAAVLKLVDTSGAVPSAAPTTPPPPPPTVDDEATEQPAEVDDEARICAKILVLLSKAREPSPVETIRTLLAGKYGLVVEQPRVTRLLWKIAYQIGAVRRVDDGRWEIVPNSEREKHRETVRAKKNGSAKKKK